MKKPERESLDAYYREAGSWADDRLDQIRKSRRIYAIIAVVAVIVAIAEALAIAVMMPLKTVIPYTLMVDKQTGYVQTLKPLDASQIAPGTALTQSFLVQYVIARESFDITGLQSNYRKVALWSAETARSDYISGIQISNPESPLARYPRSTLIETRVKSISPLGDNTALVRYETQRRDAGGQVQPRTPYVAVIRYRFSREPMSIDDRFVNPLGFQVLRYRRDAEALTSDAAPASPSEDLPQTERTPGPERTTP